MTGIPPVTPFGAGAAVPSPPIVQPGPTPLDRLLPMILQLRESKRKRQDQQALKALEGLPEGTTFGDLGDRADLQEAYARTTGRKIEDISPDLILREVTDQGIIVEFMKRAVASMSDEEREDQGRGIIRTRGGVPRTAQGIKDETTALETGFAREALFGTVALEKFKGMDSQQLLDFALLQTTGTLPAVVEKIKGDAEYANDVADLRRKALADPKSPWNTLANELVGMNITDVIGIIASGAGQLITAKLNIARDESLTDAERTTMFARADLDLAKSLAEQYKQVGLTVDFALKVIRGDESALNQPLGAFLAEAMAIEARERVNKAAVAGDPAAIQFKEFTVVLAGMLDRGVTPEELAAANLIGANMLDNIFERGALPTFLRQAEWYLHKSREDFTIVGPGQKRGLRDDAAGNARIEADVEARDSAIRAAGRSRGGPEGAQDTLISETEVSSIAQLMVEAAEGAAGGGAGGGQGRSVPPQLQAGVDQARASGNISPQLVTALKQAGLSDADIAGAMGQGGGAAPGGGQPAAGGLAGMIAQARAANPTLADSTITTVLKSAGFSDEEIAQALTGGR